MRVFRPRPGPDELVITTRTTGDHAEWSVPLTPSPTGDFYAKTRRQSKRSGGERVICKRDRSQVRHFDA